MIFDRLEFPFVQMKIVKYFNKWFEISPGGGVTDKASTKVGAFIL